MTPRPRTSLFWKWTLIVSELLLGGYMVAIHLAGHRHRPEGLTFLILGICASAACVFLLFGSPFLVASQRCLGAVALIL